MAAIKQHYQLTKRDDYLRLRDGSYWSGKLLTLQMLQHPESLESSIRFGITVTKKAGNAVIRNRIKRRLRVLARGDLQRLGQLGMDYVLIGRAPAAQCDFVALRDELRTALQQVQQRYLRALAKRHPVSVKG